MILGQRIRLDPNNVQASFFERCAGAARFAWNRGLNRWQELYAAGEKPSWQLLSRELNAAKKADLAWMYELPWAVPNHALQDLGTAFTNFFRRVRAGQKPGYPKRKKRGKCREGFAIEGRGLQFDGSRVKIPKLGWVRTRQEVRFPGKILSSRFSKHAGHWYVSIQVEVDESRWSYSHRCKTQAVVGVDLGVRDLAVLSTGEKIKAPRSLRTHAAKLRRLNKELSRRTKGGKNRAKTKLKLGKLHERIANVRKDVTHKLTASLVERFKFIGIEDLNVANMIKGRLVKSVTDAAMRKVRGQLEHKAPLANSNIIKANRFFPSSKTCSTCGVVRGLLPLDVRQWTCDACGAEHDRDVNAAINLKNLAAAHAATACCPGSADVGLADVKLLVGQESSSGVDFG